MNFHLTETLCLQMFSIGLALQQLNRRSNFFCFFNSTLTNCKGHKWKMIFSCFNLEKCCHYNTLVYQPEKKFHNQNLCMKEIDISKHIRHVILKISMSPCAVWQNMIRYTGISDQTFKHSRYQVEFLISLFLPL